jgi:transporter family protein
MRFARARGDAREDFWLLSFFAEWLSVDANFNWIPWALLSALGGAILATLTKVGLKHVDPDVGLAVQAVIMLFASWGVLAVSGHWKQLAELSRQAWICLVLAGVVTSASYLFLFHAVKLGGVSQVVPLDRLSLLFAIILGVVFLKERISGLTIIGGMLMAVGAVLIAIGKD